VRAVLAAFLGVLALEGFMLAVLDARAVGARGEDWTGFLLGPAGAALCALAPVLLWRSRRRGDHRVLRRAATGLAALLGAFWLVVPLGAALGVTHRPRAGAVPLALGRPALDVKIRTADGLRLAATYVPSRNGAAVISFPTRRGKVAQARMLARHGYGVLLLDMRGYDGSEGDANAFGWGATKDVDAAVAWLQHRRDVHGGRIGGIGFSVGGEQMLEAAAENPALRAVVSEGAGVRSVREALLRGARGLFALPHEAVTTAAVAVVAGALPPPSLEDAVARIAPRPVLLVYAEHGQGGEELNGAFFRAAHEPKELWRVAGSRHVGGLEAQPREYERRVVGFFDRALLSRSVDPSSEVQ
jgi:fermentation-respiration switch protein FrsA (DUF1100 family)